MSTSLASNAGEAVGVNGYSNHDDDPFSNTPDMANPRAHRYSSYNSHLFTSNSPASSPGQAKRILDAHLAETSRRIGEASKLGSALVKQREELSNRLREVEQQNEAGEIGPELKQKLVDIEKEYNEVGRETARAVLVSKADASASEDDSIRSFAVGRIVGALESIC